jgi:hypothetical protein
VTDAGLEIPIPTRDGFLQNINKVAPKPKPVERHDQPPQATH